MAPAARKITINTSCGVPVGTEKYPITGVEVASPSTLGLGVGTAVCGATTIGGKNVNGTLGAEDCNGKGYAVPGRGVLVGTMTTGTIIETGVGVGVMIT
jgi:hypothetical protein